MSMTLKKLADEIGVSKQAVYKRVTGKLKTVLAPYTHTEYNRMCFDDEGVRIIKNDFEETPCSTSLPSSETLRINNTEHIRNTYTPMPDSFETHTVSNTECIRSDDIAHTEALQNTSESLPCSAPNRIQNTPKPKENAYDVHTELIRGTPDITGIHSNSDTEHIRSDNGTHTEVFQNAYNTVPDSAPNHVRNTPEQSRNTDDTHTKQIQNIQSVNNVRSESNTEHISNKDETHTEHIRSPYGAHLQQENDNLRDELTEKTEELHRQEIELVKANAENEKLKEIIKQMNQRLEEKDAQISEQRQTIQKTDDERKILTASLFRNNEFIESLMRLSLTKRVFGWRNVQKSLMQSQSNIADEVTGEGTVTVQPDDIDED